MLESEMIGAIKIKDGLFIGDELASTVSYPLKETHPSTNGKGLVNLMLLGSNVLGPWRENDLLAPCCSVIFGTI